MKYKVVNEDWFENPSMVGHIEARSMFVEFVSMVDKYAKTDVQKAIVSYVVSEDIVDWHFWCMRLTKKFVASLRYTLKRVEDGNFIGLLRHHVNSSGLLKDKLTWILEGLACKYNYDEYEKYYVSSLAIYGMRKEEAVERMNKYISILYNKENGFEEFMNTIDEINKRRL